MRMKYRDYYWIIAVLVAFVADRLFWGNQGGANFFIFVLLMVLGGLLPMWLEKTAIPWKSYLLLIPILVFSAITFLRSEPFTIMISGMISLSSLILFAATLRSGAWLKFRTQDYITSVANFILYSIIGGFFFFTKVRGKDSAENGEKQKPFEKGLNEQKTSLKANKAAPYLRGLLLALPLLVILSLLLASADPVFNNRIQNLFSGFELGAIGEYLFRLFYVFVLAYIILSAYYFGLVESKKWQERLQDTKPTKRAFGSIEACIILGSINLLFLLFVILQFTYLFGGESNIHLEGFTYAEYARRGFSELLAVAVISLLVFYLLSMFTRRESKAMQWTFSVLGLILVGLVGIILASAYLRLTLYENAYGFTRLRTITHIFIIWTGLLLIGVAVLDIIKKMDRMALFVILMVFGFGLTVSVLNIDRFIVRQNITRSITTAEEKDSGDLISRLDTGYLYSLSNDSIPPLVTFFSDPSTPGYVRDDIGGVLACRSAALDPKTDVPWTSFHFARAQANDLLKSQARMLDTYPISETDGILYVQVNGVSRSCFGYAESYMD